MFNAFVVSLVTLMLCTSCTNVSDNSHSNSPRSLEATSDILVGSWTRSMEEETGKSQIFRPSDFKSFPLARFREHYILNKDGTCRFYVLAPDCAHYFTDGNWTYNPSSKILRINGASNTPEISYKIISLENDLLKVDL